MHFYFKATKNQFTTEKAERIKKEEKKKGNKLVFQEVLASPYMVL